MKQFCNLAILLIVNALWSWSAWANAPENTQNIDDLSQALMNAGWTMTPEFSAAYNVGDIYSERNNSPVIFGSDCFVAEPRESAYESLEVKQAMKAETLIPFGAATVKAGGEMVKKMTFAEPYVSELAEMSLVPSQNCQRQIEQLNSTESHMVITATLSAEVKQQVCALASGGFRIFGAGAKAEAIKDCVQDSEGHVVVAYKTKAVSDLPKPVFQMPKDETSMTEGFVKTSEDWQLNRTEQVIMTFESTPDAAVVLLDGKLLCQSTPCSKAVSVGAHSVEVQLEHYFPWEESYTVVKQSTIKADLKPEFGWLSISGRTPDVPVWLDGKTIGVTPLEHFALSKGNHEVQVYNDCYNSDVYRFVIEPGEHEQQQSFPIRAREAAVAVDAKDSDGNELVANVVLDGRSIGQTPLEIKVPVCSHELVVEYQWIEKEKLLELEERTISPLSFVFNGQEMKSRCFDDSEVAACQSLCANLDYAACGLLGFFYDNGKGVTQHKSKAAHFYRQSCDGGNMVGCYALGKLYDFGEGVSQDHSKAASLYRQSCDGGDMGGCLNLGYLYSNGKGVSQDHSKAATFYRQSCDGGDMGGCANLGYSYDFGKGVSQNKTKAATFYRQSCDGGSAIGCSNLGAMYLNGDGVPVDRAGGFGYLYKAWVLNDQSDVEITEFIDKQCAKEEAMACYYRGEMLLASSEETKALVAYGTACTKGNIPEACFQSGSIYLKFKPLEAAKSFRKSCDAKYAKACTSLGIQFVNGFGVNESQKTAKMLFDQSCTLGDGKGCYNLGLLLQEKAKSKSKLSEVERLMEISCSLGHSAACQFSAQ